MNAPNRFELLTIEEDTKIPNAATVTINKEDHTLAGMLRSQLLQLPTVLFAGYKVPHPLEPRFIIKIQTTSESTPIQAVQEACKGLIVTLSKLRDAIQKEFDTAKTMGSSMGLEGVQEGGQGGNAMDEGMGMGNGGQGDGFEEGYHAGGFSEFL